MPSLKDRPEDLGPNSDYEIESFSKKADYLVKFNKGAKERYLKFSIASEAQWSANFRPLNASITRMGTLADGWTVTLEVVNEEIDRLLQKWHFADADSTSILNQILSAEQLNDMDLYDQKVLTSIVEVCRGSSSMAEAGRKLFNVSRTSKASNNDSHRVKQMLAKYGFSFDQVK